MVFQHAGQPEPGGGRAEYHGHGIADDPPLHPHPHLPPVAAELPGIKPARGGEPQVDAAVLGEILRRPGRRPLRQIGGRPDYGHAQIGPDPDRDHVLLDRFPEPDARIEPFGDDVGQARGNGQFDPDVRIFGEQRFQDRPEHGVGRVFGDGDPDRAPRPVAQIAERHQLGGDGVERRPEHREQPLTCGGRRHAAGGAGEQPHAEPGFQPAHRVAERRLRGGEPDGGAGEAALRRDGREHAQIGQVFTLHSCHSGILPFVAPRAPGA